MLYSCEQVLEYDRKELPKIVLKKIFYRIFCQEIGVMNELNERL